MPGGWISSGTRAGQLHSPSGFSCFGPTSNHPSFISWDVMPVLEKGLRCLDCGNCQKRGMSFLSVGN